MKRQIRVLFAGHSDDCYDLGCRQLSARFKLNAILIEKESAFRQSLTDFQPDLVVSEYAAHGFSGIPILRFAKEADANLPVVFFAEEWNEATFTECLLAGADDFVSEEEAFRLPFAVASALEKADLQREKSSAEKRIVEKETKYFSYIENAPVGIIVFNSQGVCIEVNKATKLKTGYTLEEFQKFHLSDIVDSEFWKQGKKHFDAVKRYGEASTEVKIKRKDGSRIWLSVKGVALPDGNVMGFVSDISEKIEAREALENSERKYRKLISEMTQGIALHEIILNENGEAVDYRFLDMNKGFEKLTGLKKEECIGKTVLEVFPDLERSWIKKYGEVALTGKPANFEQYTQSLDRYYDVTAYSPSAGQFAAIFTDITDKKKKDSELNQALEMRNLLFQTSNDGIVILDGEHKVFDYNSRFAEMLGYERNELLKMYSWDFDSHLDRETIISDFRITPDYQRVFESKHQRKDGSVYDVEISGKGIVHNAKVYVVYICRDITERIKARQVLEKARAKAEAGDRLKTNFLNNISHELRTPLNGIIGATSLLSDKTLKRQEISELMEIINLSTERLIQTITDYMDISQITSNTVEARSKPVKVNDIIDKFKISYWQKCLDKGLSFNVELSEKTKNSYLEIDPELLLKSLEHLLQNAVKFTHYGSVTFGAEATLAQISFFVKDTGIGISKEKLEIVFEHFRQEDDGTARRFEGSGLGLSIVKGLTKIMGGSIDVESRKNSGTTVWLHFPRKNHSYKKIEAENRPELKQKSEPVILVAEDEIANFQMLEMLLHKSYNVTVLHALNGLEALKMVKSNPEIDLVLMDIKMPVMDGFESTREIKNFRPELPVVAQTAFAMSSDESRALAAGCDLYLSQPLNRNNIEQTMQKFGFKSFE